MDNRRESSKKVIKEIMREILINVGASGLIILAGTILRITPLDIVISIASTFFLTASAFLVIMHRKKTNPSISALGITGLWRDEKHFERDQGCSFTEYCRRFIKETPDGKRVRILGYDWIELFPDTIVLGQDVFGENGTSRLNFEVILMDPEAPMAIEKRAWEMTWKTPSEESFYPEGSGKDSFLRLKTKIENCVTVAKIFENKRPQFFRVRLTTTLPCFSVLMRDDKVIGVIYSLNWKGKDTLIFEAERSSRERRVLGLRKIEQFYGADFYGYLEGYFDSLWDDPSWRIVYVSENPYLLTQ